MGTPSAHVDSFARENLPPRGQWPEFLFERPEFCYPERLNCATELLDKAVAGTFAERPVIRSMDGARITYREFLALCNRIARVLVEDLGVVPGNRVLLRSANNAMLAACLFAAWKAGAIAVPTMKLLRAGELRQVIEKANISAALCDTGLIAELESAAAQCASLNAIVPFNGSGRGALEAMLRAKPAHFANVDTAADDVALIAFTSGTTGTPKAAMHPHRGVMAMCEGWPRSILKPRADDIFCGTAPLAFTYGLGTMLCIPMRFGASVVLAEKQTPESLLETIQELRCTFVATVPTFFRQMAPLARGFDTSSLRRAISSGEALPEATRRQFREVSGLELIDGIGSTEMMQTFISHVPERARPGATGYVIPGYRATVLDASGNPCAPGLIGRLAVKGPSGCLYLADERQADYVQKGWNLTGDAFSMDEDGYFYFAGRSDDLIVSSGYNISALEVEAALLGHEALAECAVVGIPDEWRGQIVTAFVVLKPGYRRSPQMAKDLQDHAKSAIAPYKYPRRIEFVAALPRNESGKLQRFRLREKQFSTAGA
ncbi:MAG: AMP-binding protein [Betaproteobacteria bacterium]|nr:AMP-binding protein [Betaproteobacteria bacterium]